MKSLKKIVLKNKYGAMAYVLMGILTAFLSSYAVHTFQKVIDAFSEKKLSVWGIVIYAGLLLTVCVLNYLDEYPSKKVKHGIYYDIKMMALEKVGRLDYKCYASLGMGETLKRIESGAEAGVGILYDFYFCLFRELLPQMIFSVTFIAMVNGKLVWVLAIGYLLVAFVTKFLLVVLSKIKEGILTDEEQVNHLWIRGFMEMVTFRLNGIFDREVFKVNRLHKRLIQSKIKMTLVHEAFFSIFAVLVTILKIGLLFYAWHTGAVSVGGLVAILALVDNAYTPIAIFSVIFVSYRMDTAAYRRFDEWMLMKEDENLLQGEKLKDFTGAFAFEDLSYTYASHEVLSGVTLRVSKGEKIALVGESGSGKSTLVKLMLGLLKATKGAVYADGENLNALSLESLYKEVAYISQEAPIFDGSLRENLLCHGVAEEDVWSVLERVQLSETIGKMPMGLETMVGESGVLLSGGERQRLALARLWFQSPKCIVLDEATSALDNITEAKVMKALLERFENQTLIAIAHRLDSVSAFERFVVFKEGKVLGDDAYETLIETTPYFRSLVEGELREGPSDQVA